MTYTYYFREPPDLTQPMPEGCTSLIFHRAPVWVDTLKCQVYGRAVYERKLSFRECLLHNLVEEGQKAEQSNPEPPEEKPGWISCSEKLPEDGVPFLAWEKAGFAYVETASDGKFVVAEKNSATVTHWMPLPEPPKAGVMLE
jgi:hypothetical protein